MEIYIVDVGDETTLIETIQWEWLILFNMEALKDENSTWGFTFPAKALAAAR